MARNDMRSALQVDTRWLDDALRRAIQQLHAGAWEAISCEVTQVRARWSSQVIFCRLTYREQGAANPTALRLVVKSGPHVRDGVELAALESLARAGMCAPSSDLVPRLLGALAEDGVLVQAEAPGTTLRALVANPRTSATRALTAAQALARWLARLQSMPLAELQSGSLRAEPYEPVERLIADLRQTPHPSGIHDALVDALDQVAALRLVPEGSPTPSHGDFHPGQALVGPRHMTTVVDFEMFAWRVPGFDVGTCLAQLLAMAWFDTGETRPGADAAQAFWRTYAREGRATWPEARFHTIRALLQVLRFALASPRPDARELRDQWAWLMTTLLSSEDDEDVWVRLAQRATLPRHFATEAAQMV